MDVLEDDAVGTFRVIYAVKFAEAVFVLHCFQKKSKRGITQPKVSDMMQGDFSNLSERKHMDCLTRLGFDIEIKVLPAKAEDGQLVLA